MSLTKKTVAYIDDSKVNHILFQDALRPLNVDLIFGIDGNDGYNKLKESVDAGVLPCLVVTDINMPNMNGFDFIKKVKANDQMKYMPILVFTTEYSKEQIGLGKQLGAAGWLQKPLNQNEIYQVINKFLRIRNL